MRIINCEDGDDAFENLENRISLIFAVNRYGDCFVIEPETELTDVELDYAGNDLRRLINVPKNQGIYKFTGFLVEDESGAVTWSGSLEMAGIKDLIVYNLVSNKDIVH